MAIKMTNTVTSQELRFPNRPTAERYAERFGGGLDRWTLSVAAAGPRWNVSPVILSEGDTADAHRVVP